MHTRHRLKWNIFSSPRRNFLYFLEAQNGPDKIENKIFSYKLVHKCV